jgi:hypothetical protein
MWYRRAMLQLCADTVGLMAPVLAGGSSLQELG